MLSLDEYINFKNKEKLQDFLKNQNEFQNSINFNSIDLSNLTPEQKIIQIKLTYKISEYLIIKDKIDWDLVIRKKSIEKYIDLFLKKLSPFIEKPELIEENRKSLTRQFFEQIIEQLIKINKFPKFHVIEKKSELNGINELCPKCHTMKINQDMCVNCFYKYKSDKNSDKNNNLNLKDENKKKLNINNNNKIAEDNNKINILNERQRILSLRQKSINIEEGNGDEKLCKKCNEINEKINIYCTKCGSKFPIVTCIDSKNINSSANNDDETNLINTQINNNYCIYFFEKIYKNHIISQLKDFGDYFNPEDFSSLKFLYSRTKEIIRKHYQDIITLDAYEELMNYLDSIYTLYSKPSPTSFKIFNKAYEVKYHKERPLTNELNFNDLSDDIREGWLPENDVNTKYMKQNVPNKNVKIYDNIIRNNNLSEDDDEIVETMMIGGGIINPKKIEEIENDNLLSRRKRGRPKKIEIFKDEAKYLNKENNSVEIIPSERNKLFIQDLISENEFLHYDFCGECGGLGKLICCETCPTAYHYECVGYDKFPRGKYKCYFCKVAKLGVSQAVTVTQKHIDLVQTLFEYDVKCDYWFVVARNLINVLKVHQCSSFFKEPVPEELVDYYKVVKEPRDLSLIEIKLNNWEYKTLHKFLDDLEYVWKDIKMYFKSNSFFWKNADVLEIFVDHLIKEEKIFERFESTKYEEITQDQIEIFKIYWAELKIKRKKMMEMRRNLKINNKKSHKKKEKYITLNENDGIKEKKELITDSNNDDFDEEDIIITSSIFKKEDDEKSEKRDGIKKIIINNDNDNDNEGNHDEKNNNGKIKEVILNNDNDEDSEKNNIKEVTENNNEEDDIIITDNVKEEKTEKIIIKDKDRDKDKNKEKEYSNEDEIIIEDSNNNEDSNKN